MSSRKISSKEKSTALSKFISTYFDVLKFIDSQTKDSNFKKVYNKSIMVKRVNPSLIIKLWYYTITNKYYDEIMSGNIDYFLNNSYDSNEIDAFRNNIKETTGKGTGIDVTINDYIPHFKKVYEESSEELINSFVNQIQILTHMSVIYFV